MLYCRRGLDRSLKRRPNPEEHCDFQRPSSSSISGGEKESNSVSASGSWDSLELQELGGGERRRGKAALHGDHHVLPRIVLSCVPRALRLTGLCKTPADMARASW